MKNLITPIALAAFLASGAAAFASCPTGSEGLPNSKWSWQVGESTTSTTIGDIDYAGKSGNGFADVTMTTTTVCLAINPAGNVNEDKSTTFELVSDPVNTQVCFNGPHTTDLAPNCR